MTNVDALLDAFQRGDRRALARLLTLAANGEALPAPPVSTTSSRIVAFTGSAGVGKSTLIGKLIELLRGKNLKVAVLACDPQSPLSGGALLGDRFRMPSRPDDDGVFIRSLAALSGHGAVAEHLPAMIRLLEVFGFDVILIETVGAGQGDTAVHELADVVVLLLQPEAGDDLQWEKAGVLEVADVIAVNKADLPGAEQTAAQVRSVLDIPGGRSIPVVLVSGKTAAGMAEMWLSIDNCKRRRSQEQAERQLLQLVSSTVAQRFHDALQAGQFQHILEQWHGGKLADGAAVTGVLEVLSTTSRKLGNS